MNFNKFFMTKTIPAIVYWIKTFLCFLCLKKVFLNTRLHKILELNNVSFFYEIVGLAKVYDFFFFTGVGRSRYKFFFMT